MNTTATVVDPIPTVATPEQAASTIAALEHSAWALAALAHLYETHALWTGTVTRLADEDAAPARVLVALGLLSECSDGFTSAPGMAALLDPAIATTRAAATTSTLRQIAAVSGILPKVAGDGWAANDDETLRAQGTSSAFGGRMLATAGVASLPGLAERFGDGGRFLDVGTGIGALGAAFAETLPSAHVVGIDVLARAVELARGLVRDRDLDKRFEVRQQSVEDLDDAAAFDLAWLPAPFIPEAVFERALANIHRALTPGGWLVIGAGRLDDDQLGAAVTRWQTRLAAGTPLSASDTHRLLADAGYINITPIPTPPGAAVLTCGQRPATASPADR